MNIYFNVGKVTHSLRIRPIDTKPGEITVFEGLVDGSSYVFWESGIDPLAGGTETWELIEMGVQAYLDHAGEEENIKTTRWVE